MDEVTEAPEQPTDFAPSGADLVVADPTDPVETFQVLDRHDEDMILRELEKQPGKFLVYEFEQGGQKIIDLSYEGVSEAIRQMVGTGKIAIRVEPSSLQVESIVEDLGDGSEPCWMATVYAEATVPGQQGAVYGQFGTFIQPKFTKVSKSTADRRKREGKTVTEDGKMPNPFARQTALSKASRNALKLFVPTRIRQALIAQARKDETTLKSILAGRGAEHLAELPPPLEDDEAKNLVKRAEKLYDEIRPRDPVSLPPGAFYQRLMRARSSHEELRGFVAALEAKIQRLDSEAP